MSSGERLTGLVGRTAELAEIAAVMVVVERGSCRAVHLVGQAGIGKTAVADAAGGIASARGWTVAWGRATAGATVPYWPWRQVLAALARGDRRLGLTGPLVDLAPTASRHPARSLRERDPWRARAALHAAVVEMLATAAGQGPVLVILDDLHWADTASVQLATLVSRSLPNDPVLLLTARRPADADVAPFIELDGQGVIVPLEPLGRGAIAELAADVTGAPIAADDVERLRAVSGGNPFVLRELLSATAGRFGRHGKSVVGVRGLTARRLSELDVDTTRVVLVAALTGTDAEEQVLAAASSLSPERFAAARDRAVQGGLLRRTDARSWGFAHELVRESVVASIPAGVLRTLHLDIAVALETISPGRRFASAIARHRRAALPAGDPQDMVDATLSAAEESARVFASEVTVAECMAGLAAIGPYGATGASWRARLLATLGRAEADAGRVEAARSTLREAFDLARTVGDVGVAVQCALDVPKATTFALPDRELETLLTTALGEVGRDRPARAMLLARRAVIAVQDPDRTAQSADAVQLARDAADASVLADVLASHLFVIWSPSTAPERLVIAAEIAAIARHVGDLRSELDARMARMVALLEIGRVAESEAELAEYERRAVQFGQPEFRFFALSRRAMFATMYGRFAEAEALARAAHVQALAAGLPDARVVLAGQLAFIALHTGEHVEEVLGMRGDVPAVLPAHLLWAVGREAEARAMLPGGLPVFEPDFVPGPERWLMLATYGELAYRFGDPHLATLLCEALEPIANRFVVAAGAVGWLGAATRLVGLCALTLGRLDDAIDRLRSAVAEHQRVGALPLLARSEVDLVSALQARGGPGDLAEARLLRADASRIAADLNLILKGEITSVEKDLATGSTFTLDRDGNDWLVGYRRTTTRLRDSKGLGQLAVLVAHPRREFAAVELAGAPSGASTEPILDDAARASYRSRLRALESALAAADECGDPTASAAAETERTALLAELRRSTGLGGRARSMPDDRERARVNVTRTIRQAIERIQALDPAAGRHLIASVRTGTNCLYDPRD